MIRKEELNVKQEGGIVGGRERGGRIVEKMGAHQGEAQGRGECYLNLENSMSQG